MSVVPRVMHVNELVASRSDLNTLCFIFPAEGSPPTRSGMYLGPGQPKRICSGSACQKNTKMVHIVQSGAYLPFEAYSPRRPLKPTVGSNDCESEVVWPDDRPRGGEWAPIYRSLKLMFSVDGKCFFAASFHGDVHEPPKNVIRVRKGYPLQHDICINFSTLGDGEPKYRIRKENQRLGNRGGEIIGG